MNFLQVPQSIIEENVFNALKEDIGEGDIAQAPLPRAMNQHRNPLTGVIRAV